MTPIIGFDTYWIIYPGLLHVSEIVSTSAGCCAILGRHAGALKTMGLSGILHEETTCNKSNPAVNAHHSRTDDGPCPREEAYGH